MRVKKLMDIIITDGTKRYGFYNVPPKVAKAVTTLLKECGNDETEIVCAEGEDGIH